MKKLLAEHGLKTTNEFYLLMLKRHDEGGFDETKTLFNSMNFRYKKEFLYCILFDGCESTKEANEFFFNLL